MYRKENNTMKLQKTRTLLFTVLCLALWIVPIQQVLAQEKQQKQQTKKGLIPFDYLDEMEAHVEVNLTNRLINLVTKSVSSKPEIAGLIGMIEGIYLRTYNEYGEAESGMIKYYKNILKENKWEVLVRVKEKPKAFEKGELVEISLLFDEDVAYGIFVIIASHDPDEVTLINIVGEIAPDKITQLLGNLSKFGMTDIDLEGTLKTGVDPKAKRDIVQKEILAVKAEKPPVIDGKLDDNCWKTAPQADGFTHVETEKLVKDQTIVKLLYTDKAIYVAWYIYDSDPKAIVTDKKLDSRQFLEAESVCFSIDPFHTHQSRPRIRFMVNPFDQRKFERLSSGNQKKSKLTNDWKARTKIVDDGWVVEMEIPWRVLDYPNTSEPIQMGINFNRRQQRTGENSWWSNIGAEKQYKDDGNWIRVLPPQKSSRMQGMLDAFEEGKYNASGVFINGKDGTSTNGDFFRLVNTSGLNPADGLRLGGGFEFGNRWNPDPYFYDRSGETIRRNTMANDTSIDIRSSLSPKHFIYGSMSLALRTHIPNYRLGGGLSFGERSNLTYNVQIHRLTSVRDRDILLSSSEQFLRAFFDTDYQHYYIRQGGVMSLQWQHASLKHTVGLSLLLEEHESIDNGDYSQFRRWYSFSSLDSSRNTPIYDGRMHSISLKYDFDTREDTKISYDLRNRTNKNEWYNTFLVEHSNPDLGATYDFTRFIIHLRNYHPIGDDRIDTRLKVGLASTSYMLPYQRQFVLGGTGTLRGYSLYEFVGNHGFLFNFEYAHNLATNIYIVPFVDVGQTWINLEEVDDIYPKVNFGIGFQLGIFRLNFARALERDSDYQANFKWSRTF